MCLDALNGKNALELIWVRWSSEFFNKTWAYIGISICAYIRGNRVSEKSLKGDFFSKLTFLALSQRLIRRIRYHKALYYDRIYLPLILTRNLTAH